uniref:EGF-like domain-containing protein n=1 Tax=Stomoxys calcitrans TaxID=35570 RepID=A0A1I8PK07_STOCA
MILIYVPTEAVDKYSWVTRMTDEKTQKVTPIKVCCPGYGLLRWRGERRCVPVCKKCRNGQCVAPDVCECYNEFVRTDNGDCVFSCPLGCLNGRCYLDGSCECDPGYKLDETRQYCRPICSKGCGTDPLLNCTAPEVCGCIQGFTLSDSGCKPLCEPECGPGGVCQEIGFKPLCACHAGYGLKDGVCQADCYQSCANGICYNRNRCICNPGFVYHERTRNCIPV